MAACGIYARKIWTHHKNHIDGDNPESSQQEWEEYNVWDLTDPA